MLSINTKKTVVVENSRKNEAPKKIVLSKNVDGNISQYLVEFTKDSK